MSDLVFQHEGIILDADCTISLASSGVFADILKTFPCQCTITQYVLQQEVLRNDIQPCIDLGLLQMVKPQGEEYDIILSIHDEVNVPNNVLGDGEIETCAIAVHRNWAVGIDDRKARGYFSKTYPHLLLVTTPELVQYWVIQAEPDTHTVQQALERIENVGNYKIGKRHALYTWWDSWFA
jgi:hypothetical protein